MKLSRCPFGALAVVLTLVCLGPASLANEVFQGHDLWSTPPGGAVEDFGGTNTPSSNDNVPAIPAGFFNPGSDPFEGRVDFQGVPLGTFNGTPTGPTDTIVRRLSDTAFAGSPLESTVQIEIVALSLQSVSPIVVTYGGTNAEDWNVAAGLAPSQPLGTMTIRHPDADPGGGTYDATVPICPILTFTRVSDGEERTIDHCATQPAQEVSVAGQSWVHDAVPPLVAQGLSGPNFFVVGQTQHDGPHPQADPVENPDVPNVPAANLWALMALAVLLLAGISYLRIRRTA